MANIVANWFREYDEYKIDHVWITSCAWNSFTKFQQESRLEVLPYWCLCSGGDNFHKHMILRYRPEDAKSVMTAWKGIQSKYSHVLTAKFRRRSDLHLLYTHLSNPQAHCLENPFVGHTFKEGNCHVWIDKPLPVKFEYFLAMSRKGLFRKLLELEIKNKNFEHAMRDPTTNQWVIQIAKIYPYLQSMMIPLQPHLEFELCEEPCEKGYYLYIGSLTLRVLRNDELKNLTVQERRRYHLNKRHVEMILNETVRFDCHGQKRLNEMEHDLEKSTVGRGK